jgi:hypothetical protein
MNGHLHAPAALNPGKKMPVLLDRRLVDPQSQSERHAEEKNLVRFVIIQTFNARNTHSFCIGIVSFT